MQSLIGVGSTSFQWKVNSSYYEVASEMPPTETLDATSFQWKMNSCYCEVASEMVPMKPALHSVQFCQNLLMMLLSSAETCFWWCLLCRNLLLILT